MAERRNGGMKPKPDDVLDRVRAELGAIRSCALMMANAQSAEVRKRYLKSLNDKLKSIESLLEKQVEDTRP